ncbi:cupin domain-containing protein [Amycolatopsis pigmentata]|uniref:Cupin domain-containing protein n=1 Tax=Amycolatopsis pigmentata TaxID=450801 RepID=A0ABW5FKS2_9PSEU
MSNSGAQRVRWTDAGDLPWQETGLDGLAAKVLVPPSSGGAYVGFTRFSRGAEIPRHRHEGDEFLYVVEGAVEDDGGTLSRGWTSYRPVGCTHSVVSPNGAVVFVVVTGTSVPASTAEEDGGSMPLAPTSVVMSGAPGTGVSEAELCSVPATGGGVARRARLLRVAAGAAVDLPPDESERVCLIVEGSLVDADGAGPFLGPFWFRRLLPSQAASAVAGRDATLILVEWTDRPAGIVTGGPQGW